MQPRSRSAKPSRMTGRIFQLSRSAGGVPKHSVPEAAVHELGLEGDKQRNLKVHGGPERALCLFSLEVISKLQAEGHPIYPGSTGENVTIAGLDWTALAAGTRLQLGDAVVVALTRPADPCKNIAASFIERTFKRLGVPAEMRWYCRIVQTGMLRVAMPVRVVD
jgi:MOSC domain-containing protein YiiM